ncbi:MAG TPA: hypothetical protein VMB79_08615 [Jatrophihabitans sp.]|nr:hypothetical protein [Jatrophihabitans sp.]
MVGAVRRNALARPAESPGAPGIAGFGADLLVLVAVAISAACSYSTTGRFFNQIAIALGALTLVAGLRQGWQVPVRRATLLVSVVISVAVQLYKPPIGNVDRALLFPGVLALTAAATVGLGVVVLGGRRRWTVPALWTVLGALAVAEFAIVACSGRPAIDVWQIFQQASAGLFHGVNAYATSYTGIPAGQTADCFNYLPATLLSSWPGWAALHDVRYSEVAVLLLGWGVLAGTLTRRAPDAEHRLRALTLVALAVSLVGTLRVGQQAWNESLLLGFLLLGTSALATGRTLWAVLLVGLALATKQHIALLLPVLACWPRFGWRRAAGSAGVAAAISAPWLIWNFARFKGCTVDFFVHGVARFDSISLWHFVPSPIAAGVTVLAVLAGYLLVYRWVPRTTGGLLIGSAVVLYAFDLFNKQSFENQWWFVCQLLLCGLAFAAAGGTEPDHVTSAEAAALR